MVTVPRSTHVPSSFQVPRDIVYPPRAIRQGITRNADRPFGGAYTYIIEIHGNVSGDCTTSGDG